MRHLHSAVAPGFARLAVLSALMDALAFGHAGLEAHVLARPDRLRVVAELGGDEKEHRVCGVAGVNGRQPRLEREGKGVDY